MGFDTVLWRGADRTFVTDMATALATVVNVDRATVTIAEASERPVLCYAITDGNVDHLIVVSGSAVNVHRLLDGRPVGQGVTLPHDDAERVRTVCHGFLDRIESRGGFQAPPEPIN